jgi:hypothetical protein
MPTGYQMKQLPAHAGPLPPWQRLTIGLALTIMCALAIVIMISPLPPQAGGPRVPLQQAPAVVPAADSGMSLGESAAATGSVPLPGIRAKRRLAAALAPVTRDKRSIAVGITDGLTVAVYNGSRPFHSPRLVEADILSALLLERQQTGTTMSLQQRKLAASMIENGDGTAAAALWDTVGQATGLAAANRLLHLANVRPGQAWRLTSMTVGDELSLLADLTSSRSPLSAASRWYELGLIRRMAAGRQPGITAGAAPRSWLVVADRWRTGDGTWVINGMGVVFRAGHRALVAVMSDGQSTEPAGLDQAEAAVRAAVSAITGPGTT